MELEPWKKSRRTFLHKSWYFWNTSPWQWWGWDSKRSQIVVKSKVHGQIDWWCDSEGRLDYKGSNCHEENEGDVMRKWASECDWFTKRVCLNLHVFQRCAAFVLHLFNFKCYNLKWCAWSVLEWIVFALCGEGISVALWVGQWLQCVVILRIPGNSYELLRSTENVRWS